MVNSGTGHDRCPFRNSEPIRRRKPPGGGDIEITKTGFGFKRGSKLFYMCRPLATPSGFACLADSGLQLLSVLLPTVVFGLRVLFHGGAVGFDRRRPALVRSFRFVEGLLRPYRRLAGDAGVPSPEQPLALGALACAASPPSHTPTRPCGLPCRRFWRAVASSASEIDLTVSFRLCCLPGPWGGRHAR